jgi:Protein of unknown function (DUF2867)
VVGRTLPEREGVIAGRHAIRNQVGRFPHCTSIASPSLAFAPVRQIGGANGWGFANFLWWLRGSLDLMAGEVGLRRGRRNPQTLAAGDAVDFWRVETWEPDRRLSLTSEMKVPGGAWLQFEVEPNIQGSVIRQTAIFDPAGLAGLDYWYVALSHSSLDFQQYAAVDCSYGGALGRSCVCAIRPCPRNGATWSALWAAPWPLWLA